MDLILFMAFIGVFSLIGIQDPIFKIKIPLKLSKSRLGRILFSKAALPAWLISVWMIWRISSGGLSLFFEIAFSIILYFYLLYFMLGKRRLLTVVFSTGIPILLASIGFYQGIASINTAPKPGVGLIKVFAPGYFASRILGHTRIFLLDISASKGMAFYDPRYHKIKIRALSPIAGDRYRGVAVIRDQMKSCIRIFDIDSESKISEPPIAWNRSCQTGVFSSQFIGSKGELIIESSVEYSAQNEIKNNNIFVWDNEGTCLEKIYNDDIRLFGEIPGFGYWGEQSIKGKPPYFKTNFVLLSYAGDVDKEKSDYIEGVLSDNGLNPDDVRSGVRDKDGNIRLGLMKGYNSDLFRVTFRSDGKKVLEKFSLGRSQKMGNFSIYSRQFDESLVILEDGAMVLRASVFRDGGTEPQTNLVKINKEGHLDFSFYKQISQYLIGEIVNEVWRGHAGQIIVSVTKNGSGALMQDTDLFAIRPDGTPAHHFQNPLGENRTSPY